MTADLDAGYEALRHGIGAYRPTRDVVAVTGPDATTYLQGQLSQDVTPLQRSESADALLLEPDGKLTALVRVTRTGEDSYALDTDGGFGDAIVARLSRFRLRTKVDITTVDWPCIALRGDGVVLGQLGASAPFALGVEWNGTRGVDLLGPGAEASVPGDAVWGDERAWEAVRIEAGIPRMGAELDTRTIAAEAHLVERTVSFTKGCYTGQELVARLDARGSRVARRLCGVVVAEAGPEDPPSLRGASLWAPEGDKVVGRVTSAAWCPGLGALGALAYLHRSVDVPGELVWAPGDDAPPGSRRRAEARPVPLVG